MEIFEKTRVSCFQIDLTTEKRTFKSRDDSRFLSVFFAFEIQNRFSRSVRSLTNRAMTSHFFRYFLCADLRIGLNTEYTTCRSNRIVLLASHGQ